MKTQTCEFGYLAAPDRGRHPGIVLIHDVWGLADHTRDVSRRLADEGFHVLGIDLYREFASKEIENPGSWIQNLSDPDLLADIRAAARFLAGHPDSRNEKVGVVGFCMGGMYALLAGCDHEGEIAATVPFYGLLSYTHGLLQAGRGLDPALKPREPLEAARELRCPMLAFFGDQDPYVSTEDVAALEISLGASGQQADCICYPGAGHAFMNDTREDAYRPDAARDAWEKMVAFLRTQLAG